MLILHLPIIHWERPRTLEGGLDFVVFCWRKRRQRAKYGMSLSSFNHYNPNITVFLCLLPTRLKREGEQPPTQHSQHSHLSRSGRHPKSQKVENAAWVGGVCVCTRTHVCLCARTHALSTMGANSRMEVWNPSDNKESCKCLTEINGFEEQVLEPCPLKRQYPFKRMVQVFLWCFKVL